MKRVILLSLLLAASCAANHFVKNSYTALSVSKITYEQATDIAWQKYQSGAVPQETMARIVELSRDYGRAHNAAVEALAAYETVRTQSAMQAFLEALTRADGLWAELGALLVESGAIESIGVLQ